MTNSTQQETDLVDAAVAWLSEALPKGWTVERSTLNTNGQAGSATIDPVVTVNGGHGVATFIVEAKRSLAPRDVEQLMAGMSRTLRALSNASVLVVAPWLSARTQELLQQDGINYIDLTGNARVEATHPALFLKTHGASRNPDPSGREAVRLRGDKAGRLIRTLVDVRPPYGVRQLASSTELSPGYVSRLLEALDREALIERARRGEVVGVDYAALIRRWAETYDVLRSDRAHRFVAPDGLRQTLENVKSIPDSDGRTAVTGSFAAFRLEPVARPALLLMYVENASAVADTLGLLPVDGGGANVVLLDAADPVVWTQREEDVGVCYVAPSQAVVDCLVGPGRMPSEGAALLGWMTANEEDWRSPSLLDDRAAGGIA